MNKLDLNRILTRLKLEPLAHGLQIVDAAELAGEHFPRLDSDRPALIVNISSPKQLRWVRRTLRVNYPPNHPVILLSGPRKHNATLSGLRPDLDLKRSTQGVLYVLPRPDPGSPLTLAAIVARLRAPAGCPWDRKQTHASLRRALLEETYEVIEALDGDEPAHLEEELGDLLLHVLFQTQIAREEKEFTLADVGEELAAKLIRRHPHVFGEVEVASADEVIQNWERIKREEKGQTGQVESPLEANIPGELPALTRAQKVYDRARRAGMPADGMIPVEEGAKRIERARDRERALGDLLFALAAWAEENGVDASSALRAATKRFAQKNERAGLKPAL